jgi:hypothetical protein
MTKSCDSIDAIIAAGVGGGGKGRDGGPLGGMEGQRRPEEEGTEMGRLAVPPTLARRLQGALTDAARLDEEQV